MISWPSNRPALDPGLLSFQRYYSPSSIICGLPGYWPERSIVCFICAAAHYGRRYLRMPSPMRCWGCGLSIPATGVTGKLIPMFISRQQTYSMLSRVSIPEGACAAGTHAPYISADLFFRRTLNHNEAAMEPGLNCLVPGEKRWPVQITNQEAHGC